MYFVKVYVTYKDSVLDPKGVAVKNSLHRSGYEEVEEVRIGKYFEMKIKKTSEPIHEVVEKMCDELLANVNMESYRFEITEEK